MKHENFEAKLIRQQNLYIRQLEEQLNVYMEKDKAQELLIFLTTSLSYQLKAVRKELADFRSGEAYVKLRADYENIIRGLNATIKKLQKERDDFSFSRKEITRQWMDVLEDVQKEHEKEVKKLKKAIAELLDLVASLKNRNAELDEKRKQALHDYYETAASPCLRQNV